MDFSFLSNGSKLRFGRYLSGAGADGVGIFGGAFEFGRGRLHFLLSGDIWRWWAGGEWSREGADVMGGWMLGIELFFFSIIYVYLSVRSWCCCGVLVG